MRLDPNFEAALIGVSLPGPIDPEERVARICINLPGWENVPLAEWLESRLDRFVTIANDGNCALLGESWKGAALGYKDVILLTLGTGVGGGVLINGQLFRGRSGASPEPGLICLDPEGPICNSGNNGSLEQFVSLSGLKRLSNVDPLMLNDLANHGDSNSLDIWNRYGTSLGIGLSSLIYMFTPQLVLIGGGIAGAAHHFLPAARSEVIRRVHKSSREYLIIEACALGNNGGCLGAAFLALQKFKNL